MGIKPSDEPFIENIPNTDEIDNQTKYLSTLKPLKNCKKLANADKNENNSNKSKNLVFQISNKESKKEIQNSETLKK